MISPHFFPIVRFSAALTPALGWALWIGCVVLISYYVYLNDIRVTIPRGQYLFFALTILASIILLPLIKGASQIDSLKLFLFFLTALFVYVFLSAIFGMSGVQGARLAGILLLTLPPFVIFGYFVGRAPLYRLILPLFFLALISAAGAVVLQWSGPVEIGGVRIGNYLHGTRWSFLFEEANGLAGILAIGVTTLLYFSWVAKKKTHVLLLIGLVMPFMLYVFWMTNSRASLAWLMWTFMVFGCAAFVLFYMNHKSELKKYIFLSIGLLSMATVVYAMPIIEDVAYKYLRLYQPDLTSGRLYIWEKYWKEFLEHPLLGIGFGATPIFLEGQNVQSPLNVYVGMLGETGLAGLVPLMILWGGGLFYSLRAVIRTLSIDSKQLAAGLWCLAMLGGMALQQNGEWEIMRVSLMNYVFFFTLTVAWVHCSQVPKPVKPTV